MPKPLKGKDEDLLQFQRPVTLAEFLPKSFHKNYLEEVLEVVTCHVVNTAEGEDIPSSALWVMVESENFP